MAAAASLGNLVHLFATSGRTDEAVEALKDLYAMAEYDGATTELRVIGVAMAPVVVSHLTAIGQRSRGRKVLSQAHDMARGVEGDTATTTLVAATMLRVGALIDDGQPGLAEELYHLELAAVRRLNGTPDVRGSLADGARRLISACVEAGDLARAIATYGYLVWFAQAKPWSHDLVKAWVLAATEILVAFADSPASEDPTEDDLELIADVVDSAREVLNSPEFDEAMSSPDDAYVALKIREIFEATDSDFDEAEAEDEPGPP